MSKSKHRAHLLSDHRIISPLLYHHLNSQSQLVERSSLIEMLIAPFRIADCGDSHIPSTALERAAIAKAPEPLEVCRIAPAHNQAQNSILSIPNLVC
jgi:hypothetical protein